MISRTFVLTGTFFAFLLGGIIAPFTYNPESLSFTDKSAEAKKDKDKKKDDDDDKDKKKKHKKDDDGDDKDKKDD